MALMGRIINHFNGLLLANARATFQPEVLAAPINSRLYSRKSNAIKRAKKAQLRALKKADKQRFVKGAKIIRPFPIDESADKEPSTDNVWFKQFHPLRRLTFEEAVSCHRETAHETVMNNPGAFVKVVAVLNLTTKKDGTMLDRIKGSFMPAHLYPTGQDLRILALCLKPEDTELAIQAGAFTAGGLELIKSIEEGNLQPEEYDEVVGNNDILPYLAPIRGLLKTKMPKVNQGTLGKDISTVITKVKESRSYNLIRDTEDGKIGWVEDTVGKLNMPDEHLKDNLQEYLEGILKQQPRVSDVAFITDLYVRSPASDEVLLLEKSTLLREETIELSSTKRELVQEFISSKKSEPEDETADN